MSKNIATAVQVEKIDFKPPLSLLPFFISEKFISLQLGPIGCVAGGTLVLTSKGAIPIADIDRPVRVVSWDEKSCQFVLSWCGGSFPKGRECLYRVVTPSGEFDAAGQHQLLCADNEYRRVENLRGGDILASCSGTPLQTSKEPYLLASPLGAPHYSQRDVDYLGDCAALNRLRGQSFLSLASADLVSVPSHSDVQAYSPLCAPSEVSQWGALLGGLSRRIRLVLSVAQQQTGDYLLLDAPLCASAVNYWSALYGVRNASLALLALLFQQKTVHRLRKILQGLTSRSSHSPSLTSTDRVIISVTKLAHKEAFWDMQVEDTHNYVTIDGAIHHNSAKTSAGIMKIAYHAAQMHPCSDGIRRSRAVWVRQTREMLDDTSIPDFLKWFPDGVAGAMMKTGRRFFLKFGDVECEVLFRGLDDSNDVRRLLSLNASFAIFDEFRETNPDVFSAMQGRLGRYPDKIMLPAKPGVHSGGCIKDDGTPNKLLWGMSNPPDADSFWEQYYNDPPENAAVFTQPGGMDELADWKQYLPENYYEDLITSHANDPDWIDVYVHAKFGKSLAGKPVFRSFDSKYHVAKETIQPLAPHVMEAVGALGGQEYPLIIGMDFGLTPACTINQQDTRGRFLTLGELVSEGMGILRFCREKLKPYLTNHFPGYPVVIIGDPAGTQRAQTDERSVFDVLKAEGFTVIPAKTNSIQARLAAVENLLGGQVDTGPRHLIDPGCKRLITALRSGYRYKIKKTGDIEDKPDKNFYSHLADAHQYACLHVDQTFGGAYQNSRGRRNVVIAPMTAWT